MAAETTASPLVLMVVLLAAILILVLPRKLLIWGYLIPAITIPMQQAVMIGYLHVRPLQILTIVAL